MYVVTGNDDVFALNAKTGENLWERWSGIDQKISTVCCGLRDAACNHLPDIDFAQKYGGFV
jgi:glucose dehydrogenase